MLRLRGVELPLAEFVLAVDLELAAPVTAIIGESGAGKTSLLEIVAGFRRPLRGRVEFDGEVLSDAQAACFAPPRSRRIGYVPQDETLFPHLSVRRNLAYGSPPKDPDRDRDLDRVARLLDLESLLDRGIERLSGGERRRVAIGRALLLRPRLLLCDEPLTGLDADRKGRILAYLKTVQSEFGIPMVYVAHDAAEVRALSGDIVVLERGRVRDRCAEPT